MGIPGAWASAPAAPSQPPVAARQAPLAYALVLIHPIPTLAFTLWAVDGLLHCNDPDVTCHLGFAVHLLFPAAAAVAVATAVGIVGLTSRPATRARTRFYLLAPALLTALTLWWSLAATADS